ncbi:MAG: hypothetical protein RL375_3263 [Pseudomonadota bacterium]|jgi:hypothetical protein
MYLVAVGWLYVALMMALAELVHPTGGALGALVTFVLYGVAPLGLLMYLMATPLRRKARLQAERAAALARAGSTSPEVAGPADVARPPPCQATTSPASASGPEPDAGRHAPGTAVVAAVRKEV